MTIYILLGAVQSVLAKQAQIPLPVNQHNLVILQYHHVSTETPSSTSVTPKTFAKHMAFLSDNYHIIDLAEALSKIKNNQKLPNKSVAITFDDGYINILENAHPILSKYNFPYTIFINPAIIDVYTSQLSWSQIKQMQPLATFANHSFDHAHLIQKNKNETHNQWIKRAMDNINNAEVILTKNIGYSKKWIAFPFGEFNSALKQAILSQGYIGFGQQSGAVGINSDFGALPRYPAAGDYADLDSLEIKLDSFAMPVKSVEPIDNEFIVGETLDQIVLEIDDIDVKLLSLTCFFDGRTLVIKQSENKAFVKVNHKLSPGRARINCTAPSKAFNGRFYWYSFPMFTPSLNGEFLD
jgi:peptidoglycan/xylan/chitin deacetylase (PgdA/CDA1 family)